MRSLLARWLSWCGGMLQVVTGLYYHQIAVDFPLEPSLGYLSSGLRVVQDTLIFPVSL